MPRTIIEFHALHTVPPSNLNRDDTGSPKTAVFGGVRRSRVSSQSWKRAIRLDFRETLDSTDLGWRTKQIVRLVAERVMTISNIDGPTARDLTVKAFNAGMIEVKIQKKGDEIEESGYLVFLSRNQINELAEAIATAFGKGEKLGKKQVTEILKANNSIDLALFGRMVAKEKFLNVDAACQVAHAISVHGVATDYDYYTAVDDQKDEEAESGAGMIGTVEFNSATLYRYANLDVDRLRENLGDDAATTRAAVAFTRSFIRAMPSGKMNTFANRTLPEVVLVTVRDSQAINLAGAFEQPIAETNGRLERTCEELRNHLVEVAKTYGERPLKIWTVRLGNRTKALAETGDQVDLQGLLDGVGALVSDRIGS
ncbi:type I-E CRISPR-associated protein Cas7/Cse4/CasC [Glycomyces endophyticus]|uniref:Type I-E CRISPR-associated protein Cas7/Cse4/CasC n=1 Tax=Glycomyces endophyticus TaxID=480996 RepID=A0ABP4RQU3_9ACTN